MGYTEDQGDLDQLAAILRQLAETLDGCTSYLGEFQLDWKTPYDVRLHEVLDPLADISPRLHALANEIDLHETRGQADA